MIQIPAQASVFVMHESVSFRMGIDGMAAVARQVLCKEPMSGALFVFRNRGRHMLRILFYDGGGFWLCTRRLSKGRFKRAGRRAMATSLVRRCSRASFRF